MNDRSVPGLFDRLEVFWRELVRRRVVHVAGVYAIASWIIVYMVASVYETLFLPEAVLQTLVALTFLGFPVLLVLAWYFRLGRGGVHIRPAGGDRATRLAGKAMGAGLLLMGLLFAGAAYLGVADRMTGTEARDPVLAERSVAVLPFENMSLDPESRWFSDGMTEEVIARLARVPDLRVISRTSIMRYRDTDLGVDRIGRELGVATVLEGSVRRDGDHVRISARLVDTRSTRSLWAESWDRGLGDVFAIQSDLADRIAHSLGVALAGGDPRATPDLEAYDLYLRGRFFWNQRTGASLGRAIELFEEAVARDPTFAMAHAGLADAWVVLPYHTPTPAPPALDAALEAADRALHLNPDLGEAHAARAFALTGRWEWDAAETEFRRALELSPGYATAHQWLALLLLARGDPANALTAIRRAHELDPLSRVIGYELGLVLFVTGRNDEALATFDRVIELDPGFPTVHLHRAWVLDHVGRHEEAVEALERWNALLPAVAFSAGALQAALVNGGPAAVHRFLADLPPDVPVPTLDRAGWSLRAGRVDDAFAWLERGLEARETWFFLLANSPATEPIREDPRFRELLRAMDLAPDTL